MRPRVKICGITSPGDAQRCFDAGADAVGVVFTAGPRRVSVERAAEIRRAAAGRILVGVFVDETVGTIARAARAARLDLIQLHDCDDAEVWSKVAAAAGAPVLPAVTADRAAVAAARVLSPGNPHLLGLLLDLPKRPGAASPEDRAAVIAAAGAWRSRLRIAVAGALDPSNVSDVVRRAKPWGVDVSRGVERAPGVKDEALVRRFVAAARSREVLHVR